MKKTFTFSLHKKNSFGDIIDGSGSLVKVTRVHLESAREWMHTKYPKKNYFFELQTIANL